LCFVHVPQVKRDKLDKKAILGFFVGYSTVFKAYRVYHPQTEKMTITRYVYFCEDEQWDWNNSQRIGGFLQQVNKPFGDEEQQQAEEWMNELEDDHPVRGRRLLLEIYQGCNVTIYESTSPEEALQDPKWKIKMEKEMSMIRKNKI